jgi:putative phosphoribosyl transferase
VVNKSVHTHAGAKVFIDRHDAGYEVAKLLEDQYKGKHALVLGIPRGGVVIAYEIAKLLAGDLSVLITKKLPHPRQAELAIGAAAEDGSTYLTSYAQELDRDSIRDIVEAQLKEIKTRVQRFRFGKPLPEMFNRIVIIADDGIATGSTIVPAIKLCKSRKAAKVIVASPVSSKQYVSDIHALADEIVVVEKPQNFSAVGQVYQDFHHLSDEEVVSLLEEFSRSKSKL